MSKKRVRHTSWDINAEAWSDHVRGKSLLRNHLIDPAIAAVLGKVANQRVLDAGCGEGRYARRLARSGARVTAVDASREMIRLAREEEQREALGIDYRVASLRI